MPKTKLFSEIKHKHSVNSENKKHVNGGSNVIPDEKNLKICLTCPLNRCKARCGRLNK